MRSSSLLRDLSLSLTISLRPLFKLYLSSEVLSYEAFILSIDFLECLDFDWSFLGLYSGVAERDFLFAGGSAGRAGVEVLILLLERPTLLSKSL